MFPTNVFGRTFLVKLLQELFIVYLKWCIKSGLVVNPKKPIKIWKFISIIKLGSYKDSSSKSLVIKGEQNELGGLVLTMEQSLNLSKRHLC